MDRLERLGIALVGAPRQHVQRLQVLRQLGDARMVGGAAFDRPHRFGSRLPRRFEKVFACVGKRLLDMVEPWRDVFHLRQAAARALDMRRQGRNLRFQALDQLRIDRRDLPGARTDLRRDLFQPGFQAVDRVVLRRVFGGVLHAGFEIGEALVELGDDPLAGRVLRRVAGVQPLIDLVQPPLEVAEQRLALRQRIALPAFEQGGQLVEPPLEPVEDDIHVGRGGCVVELARDHRDLVGQPLHGVVRHVDALGDVLDAVRQKVEPVDEIGGWLDVGEVLDLARQRRDPRLDPLEGFGVEIRRPRHGRGSGDGARDLVEPGFQGFEHVVADRTGLACRELVDRVGEDPHLVLERAQRERFRQIVDRVADLLEMPRQRGEGRVHVPRPRVFGDAVFEPVPLAIELVPALADRANGVFACEFVQRGLHFLQFEAKQADAAVVSAFRKGVYGVGQPFELGAELGARRRGRRGRNRALQVGFQRLELAPQAAVHLLAQLVAQPLDLGSDLADGGESVLVAA